MNGRIFNRLTHPWSWLGILIALALLVLLLALPLLHGQQQIIPIFTFRLLTLKWKRSNNHQELFYSVHFLGKMVGVKGGGGGGGGRGGDKVWARSIGPKFPEIPVQDRMEQNVSGNSFRIFWTTSRGCPFFPGISCSIGHYHSVSSSSRPKRWQRQVFSPAIRMFLRFTRHRIILMTHFNVSDATTRFVQFLEEKFLDLVKCNVT